MDRKTQDNGTRGMSAREDTYNIIPFVIPYSCHAEVTAKAREICVALYENQSEVAERNSL